MSSLTGKMVRPEVVSGAIFTSGGAATRKNVPLFASLTTSVARDAKFSKENEYDPEGCYCAASLITSKHALTAFHCVDGDMESETYTEKSCELRDLSKRENHFCF